MGVSVEGVTAALLSGQSKTIVNEMKLYEINDQVNRWEHLCPGAYHALKGIFQVNYPNFKVEMHTQGIFRVFNPIPLGHFTIPIGKTIAVPTIHKFDISIVYLAFIIDPEIPPNLQEETLRFIVSKLGPPDQT